AEQGQHARVGIAQRRGPLTTHLDGLCHVAKHDFTDRTIVADLLNVQQTPVGSKADFLQGGKVVQPLADLEVHGVVNHGLGAQGASFLVILLDATPFVVDVQRWGNSLGHYPRSEPPRCALVDRTLENQLYVVGTANVQVFTDDFLKEDAAGERSVQDLGKGEFHLEDGDLVAIARGAVRGGKRMRQAG